MDDVEIDYLAVLTAEREKQQRESQQAFLEYMDELNEDEPDYPHSIYNEPYFIEMLNCIDGGEYVREEQLKRPLRVPSFSFDDSETLSEMCNFDADIDSLMD